MPTTATPAPITTTNILGVSGKLWLNVALPATSVGGAPPGRLILHTDGSPDNTTSPNAVYIGGTEAGLKLTTGFEVQSEYIDELTSPWRQTVVRESAMIEGVMKELLNFTTLAKMLHAAKLWTGTGYKQITGGGAQGLAAVTAVVIAPAVVTGEWVYFMLYSAVNALGLALELTKTKSTGTPFRMEGQGLPGRAQFDQLYQIYDGIIT